MAGKTNQKTTTANGTITAVQIACVTASRNILISASRLCKTDFQYFTSLLYKRLAERICSASLNKYVSCQMTWFSCSISLAFLNTSSTVIKRMHLKCPHGHFLPPCSAQGRQGRPLTSSTR